MELRPEHGIKVKDLSNGNELLSDACSLNSNESVCEKFGMSKKK